MVERTRGTKAQRQMKLSLFLTGDGNYHMAGWRLPGSTSDGGQNIHRWFEAAQTIERGKLHMLFIADAASPPGTSACSRRIVLFHSLSSSCV